MHCTFALICFTFMLYGNMSDPLARSLVSCDVPVTPGEFTGSQACGDRLQVIEQGQALAAAAKAGRLAVTLASCTALGVLSDISGRRAFIAVYVSAMLASVLCIALTSGVGPSAAFYGYLVSACLAGLFSIDQNGYRLVLADLAEKDGDKSQLGDLYQVQAIVQAVAAGGGIAGSLVIASMDLSSYTAACLPIACLVLACGFMVFVMEEPSEGRVRGGDSAPRLSLWGSLSESAKLLAENDYLWRKLPVMLCGGVTESFGSVLVPFTMAVYGWKQESAGKLMVVAAPAFMSCLALSAPLARRVGERRMVTACLWLGVVGIPAALLLMPISEAAMHAAHVFVILNNGLTRSLLSAVDMQLTDERIRGRFQSLLSVGKLLVGIAMQPVAAWLFDATATDYATRARPMAFLAVFICATNAMQLFQPLGDVYLGGLDLMTADRLSKANVEEAAATTAEVKKVQ